MAITFSREFLNKFVAPEITELGSPSPPDLSELAKASIPLLYRFALVTALGRNPREPHRAYVIHLLRRNDSALREFEAGRLALGEFTSIPANEGLIHPFFEALLHYENCIASAYQGIMIFRKLKGHDLFERGDGSSLERLSELYNVVRHADDRIELGELPAEGSMPIWLSETGIHSSRVALSYEELAELLTELSGACSQIVEIVNTGSASILDSDEGASRSAESSPSTT